MEDLKLKSQAALVNDLCLSRDTAQECRTAAQGGTKLGVRGVTVREAWYRRYHRKIPTAARSAGGTSRKRPKSLQEETPRYNARDVDADEAAKRLEV